MLATYSVFWGLLDRFWGNLQVLWGLLGCMLATYSVFWGLLLCFGGNLKVLWGCLTAFGAVCWQPTGLRMAAGSLLGQPPSLMGLLDCFWGCMLATYRSYGGCWTALGAVCWQPTGLIGVAGPPLGLYVVNLQVLWGLLDRLWGCMLATYRFNGACWSAFGTVCWQPTGLIVSFDKPNLGLRWFESHTAAG